MYGFRHHVEGERGLSGNPELISPVRYAGWASLAAALLAGCVGFSGWLQRGSGFFETLSVLLLIGGVTALIYESKSKIA